MTDERPGFYVLANDLLSCEECGALVHHVAAQRDRHFAWHENLKVSIANLARRDDSVRKLLSGD